MREESESAIFESEPFPYLALPANFLKLEGVGGFRDLAVARNLAVRRMSWAIIADAVLRKDSKESSGLSDREQRGQ